MHSQYGRLGALIVEIVARRMRRSVAGTDRCTWPQIRVSPPAGMDGDCDAASNMLRISDSRPVQDSFGGNHGPTL